MRSFVWFGLQDLWFRAGAAPRGLQTLIHIVTTSGLFSRRFERVCVGLILGLAITLVLVSDG